MIVSFCHDPRQDDCPSSLYPASYFTNKFIARCTARLLFPPTCNSFFRSHHQDLRRRWWQATIGGNFERVCWGCLTSTPLFSLTLTWHIRHDGPVWQVAWAHPKFGSILASCSYDGRVFIWKEQSGVWTKIKEHVVHTASVNSISWAPHELGPILACASSDGKVSTLEYKGKDISHIRTFDPLQWSNLALTEDGSWDTTSFDAHTIGCNAVSWAPSAIPGSLVQVTGGAPNVNVVSRFASAGCDNLIKIWSWKLVNRSLETNTFGTLIINCIGK